MKKFFFTGEGKRYLQFRMEGSNIFKISGFGRYNTGAGNTERRIQMSARIVF